MQKKLIYLSIGMMLLLLGTYINEHYNPKTKQPEAIEGVPILAAHAIDGDTIELINGQRLRYIGIDTPEEFDERKPIQCFAVAAANKNHELVDGKLIKFYKDVSVKDSYGRLLGFVYLEDGTFVNLELVKQGFAFAYPFPPDVSKEAEFRAAEEGARGSQIGLWKDCEVSKTSSGRKQTNPAN